MLEEPEGYDPFRRVFLYGEEGQAAEDTPFVLFQAWWLPVDLRLYVKRRRSAAGISGSGRHPWHSSSRAVMLRWMRHGDNCRVEACRLFILRVFVSFPFCYARVLLRLMDMSGRSCSPLTPEHPKLPGPPCALMRAWGIGIVL